MGLDDTFCVGVWIALLVALLAVPGAAIAEPTVTVTPGSETVESGETVTYDVLVRDADQGVGSYDLTIRVADGDVATVEGAAVAGSPEFEDVSVEGDRVELQTSGVDAEAGDVRVATVTVNGSAGGDTGLETAVTALGDREGRSYGNYTTGAASLTVTSGADEGEDGDQGNDGDEGDDGSDDGNDDGDDAGPGDADPDVNLGPYTTTAADDSDGDSDDSDGTATTAEPVTTAPSTETTTERTPTGEPTTTAAASTDDEEVVADDPGSSPTTAADGAGFGVLAVALAVTGVVLLGRRRS